MRYWLLTHKVFVRTLVMAIIFLSTMFYPRTAVKAQIAGAFAGHWFGIVQCQNGAYGYRDWYLGQRAGVIYGTLTAGVSEGAVNGNLITVYTANITETFNDNGPVFTYSVRKSYDGNIYGKLVPDSPVHGACTITMKKVYP